MLITGLPGTGKTTLLRGLANRLAKYNPRGFYTEEIRTRRETQKDSKS
ncbi:nucleoside-triphosphatase [Nitrospira sp. Nam80]